MLRAFLAAAASLLAVACARAEVKPRPAVLAGAFTKGFVGEAEGERYPLRTVRLGEVNIASGRVVVADPFLLSEREEPLSVKVPPGRYPVDLAVADTGQGGHRVALARLTLSARPAARWTMATTVAQTTATLKPGEIFGYGVDAGTGSFVDGAIPAWLGRTYPSERSDDLEKLTDGWISRGEARGKALGIPHGFALIDDLGPGGVAMFASGWGDGFYASWVGYDAADAPVAIVTDFGVIDAVDMPAEDRKAPKD